MNVSFKHCGAHLASSRYRALIPTRELAKLGIGQGNEWVVMNKHGWKWEEQTKGFKKACFDICDDHFDNPIHKEHYTTCAMRADLVTCNSTEMQRIIWEKVGRDAIMIPDPYEQPEKLPRVHDSLLWFGHRTNLRDIAPWIGRLQKLDILTNAEALGFPQWSPEAMDAAFDRAGMVVIPTGKSHAKSGNRAIESIRRGLFVVAGYLPAYADLGIYIGDIGEGVKWALSHRAEVINRIKASQAYVREEYSPERIGKLWRAALFG